MTEKPFTPYQQYIAKSKYARFLPAQRRREHWHETVDRYFDFMVENVDIDSSLLQELREAVLNREVMPSMRLMMTAGPAARKSNIAGFNCSFITIDDQKAFDEVMYILMNGTGVGFSVEQRHVKCLPEVPEVLFPCKTKIIVHDSKEGWAKAYRQLVALLYSGEIPQWDLSAVRPAGTPLETFGGRASGPEPLEDLFRFTIKTFNEARGRRLTSLECHDIVCKVADIVVVGGVRRSALISLSNLSDQRIAKCKSGQWWAENGQRALANNSAVYREKPEASFFLEEWKNLIDSNSGERGIFNHVAVKNVLKKIDRQYDENMGTNPCGEIILNKNQFCNLTTVVVYPTDTHEDLKRKIRLATILGTYQASLTHFPYLRRQWKTITEKEALLGVSMTGIYDNPLTYDRSDPTLPLRLEELRDLARQTNEEFAPKFGVNVAAAITCVKPEGCQHVETLVATSEGILELGEMGDPLNHNFQPFASNLEVVTDAEPQESTAYKGNGFSATKLIQLNSGLYLEATHNHQYRVLRGEDYVWVRADEIEEDDKLPYRVGGYVKTTEQPLVEAPFIYEKGHWRGKQGRKNPLPKSPEAMNEDLAWLLGVYTGDGSNHKAGIRIHCSYDLNHVNKIAKIAKEQFGLTACLNVKPQGKNMVVVNLNSRALLDWLKANNLSKKGSPSIEIPLLIRSSSSASLASFISGYHSADGCDAPAGRTFCTVSYRMAKQVAVCLRSLGTDASIREMPPTDSSKGSRMRYWIAERKGLNGRWTNTKRGKDIQILQDLGKDNLLFDTVVSVSDSVCLTADLSVPENNTYLANSYVSHNTTSQLCGVSSGIHPQHSQHYIRSARSDNKDPLTQFMKDAGVRWEPCVAKPESTTVFFFPVKAAEFSVLRDDLDAINHLELWRIYQTHYCEHKPSITVSVRKDEWLRVGAWVWDNWDVMTGVAFLPYDGGSYRQAPYESCDETFYSQEVDNMRSVVLDWDQLVEGTDNVEGAQNLACSGGYCEI